jgi:hypothetical protein
MCRFWKAPVIAVIALGSLMISAPTASAMPAYRGGVGFRGGVYYGPRWGWGGGWGWGLGYYPGWYGGWGPGYYWGPGPGKVKIVTPDKNAGVFVDGGFVGPVAKAKKFPLRPGTHDVELRDPNGQVIYNQEVNVIRGRTVEVNTGAVAPVQPAPVQPGHPG